MKEKKALKLTNYIIAILLIVSGIAFSWTAENILPFSIGFTGAAMLIGLYRNITWDYKEKKAYFKNSLAEIKKIFCEKCGALNPWWSEYCTNCGEELLIEEKKCPECYNTNPPRSVFCGVCGTNLTKKQPKKETQEQKKRQESKEKEPNETEETSYPPNCPECGYRLNLEVRKCPWCGADLNKTKNE